MAEWSIPESLIGRALHNPTKVMCDEKGEIVRLNLYNFNFAEFRNGLKALKNFTSGSVASLVVK